MSKPQVKKRGDAPAAVEVVADFRGNSTLGYGDVPDFLSNTEVFDEGDQAQWVQLSEQAAIRERAQRINAPETHPYFDGVHCVECGDDIPKGRLDLKKIRCVDCQGDLDIKNRQYAS